MAITILKRAEIKTLFKSYAYFLRISVMALSKLNRGNIDPLICATKLLAFLLLQSIAWPVFAEVAAGKAAQILDSVLKIEAMLDLTDEQTEQLEPILLERSEKRLRVMEQHGISADFRSSGKKIGFFQRRAIKKDMVKIDKETEKQLARVLSENQLNEYKRIQDELRAEMRERAKTER